MKNIESLRISGYGKQEVIKNITAALVGYERKVQKVRAGEIKMHRKKSDIRRSTHKKKLTIKTDWYTKQGQTDRRTGWWGNKRIKSINMGCMRDAPSAPLFVPRTNNGRLARDLVKIVEEGGLTPLGALSSKNSLGKSYVRELIAKYVS